MLPSLYSVAHQQKSVRSPGKPIGRTGAGSAALVTEVSCKRIRHPVLEWGISLPFLPLKASSFATRPIQLIMQTSWRTWELLCFWLSFVLWRHKGANLCRRQRLFLLGCSVSEAMQHLRFLTVVRPLKDTAAIQRSQVALIHHLEIQQRETGQSVVSKFISSLLTSIN